MLWLSLDLVAELLLVGLRLRSWVHLVAEALSEDAGVLFLLLVERWHLGLLGLLLL